MSHSGASFVINPDLLLFFFFFFSLLLRKCSAQWELNCQSNKADCGVKLKAENNIFTWWNEAYVSSVVFQCGYLSLWSCEFYNATLKDSRGVSFEPLALFVWAGLCLVVGVKAMLSFAVKKGTGFPLDSLQSLLRPQGQQEHFPHTGCLDSST